MDRGLHQVSKLEPFKQYLKERLKAGVWNAQVLFRELRERNYSGGYSTLTEWLRPQRKDALTVAVRRFETPPGKQAQVDWGHLGSLSEAEHRTYVVGLHHHAGLQPHDDGRGRDGPEAGNVAAHA